jgi:hypothetical protein
MCGFLLGAHDAETHPHWQCHAEDEVVIIDHTCQQIDQLTHEDLRRFEQEGVSP